MEEFKSPTIPSVTPELPQLTDESIAFMLKAAKWGKFLAILGFIIAGLMAIGGVLMSFVLSMVKDEMVPLNMPFSPRILSLFYILIAGVYLIPVLFLNSFSNNAIKAINLGSTKTMTSSLRNLKNLFVFVGISTIVILALYTVALFAVGAAAVIGF